MSLTDLPFFSAMKTRMGWHQARQSVLADNVANADTPGFRGRDLRPVDFRDALAASRAPARPAALTTVRTAPGHIGAQPMSAPEPYDTRRADIFEVTPRGNAVVLEEEMMKVASNQMDFQAASSLYQRGLGIIRLALGRSA